MAYPHEATSINLGGTVTLLECLRLATSIKRVVFASSSFVYGHFEREPAGEEHPCRPIDVYGVTKLSGEMLTRISCAQAGVEHVVVRPSAVYGFTDSNRRTTQIFVERALAGQPLTLHDGGAARLAFTYVEDIAAGLALAALHPAAKNETFNMTRGRARSVAELAEVIRALVPGVDLVSQPTDMVRPNRGTPDVAKARRLLGYDPTCKWPLSPHDFGLAGLCRRHAGPNSDGRALARHPRPRLRRRVPQRHRRARRLPGLHEARR